MSKQFELKACKCGAFYGYMLEGIQYGSKYEIRCMNCGESTGLKESFEKAAEAWNRRVVEENDNG